MSRLGRHFLGVVAVAVALLACTGTAQAQGSRKDDIVLNAQGRPMAGASVRVCTSTATGQPCSPLASLFSDPGLTQALANPIATDGLGNYSFYATPGRYEIEISGPGITTKQLPNVILPSDPMSPTFTTVTTTSGISAFSLSLTGNLTVSGSTAVTGALTVGGTPVPSTTQENQWTASQHFKGPNPWRDFSAYMKDSNGNSVSCSATTPVSGADTTGTISSGSTTLTLAAARDFKNGCGVAVLGAGPTSTLPAPPSTPTVSSAARSGTTVTLTFSGTPPAGMPSPYVNTTGFGVQVSNCSVAAYNGTFAVQTTTSGSGWQLTYTAGSSATDTATSCTVAFIFGYAHGATGSTTYNYKVVACDQNEGCSPASANLAITTGNATLTKDNYNWLTWPFNTSAYIWLIYSDKGLGGALTCVNAVFNMAATDMGADNNTCPPWAPVNPPGAATAQSLFTTISAGAGSTSLTLAAAASNTATTQNVYHDESNFLNSCITDTNNAQNGAIGGSDYGCYVPPGTWGMNGPLLTSTLAPNANLHIKVAGEMNFQTQPWFIGKSGYQIEGVGGGGLGGITGDHSGATRIQFGGLSVPGGFVLRTGANNTVITGFMMQYVNGVGIWMGMTDPSNSPGSVRLSRNVISEQNGQAPCFTIDSNVIGLWMDHNTCSAGTGRASDMPGLYITHTIYAALVNQIIHVSDETGLWHTVKVDDPGGNGSGAQVHDIEFDNWVQENSFDVGFISFDAGPNVPGTSGGYMPLGGVSLNHVLSSDGGTTTVVQHTGQNGGQVLNVTVNNSTLANAMGCNVNAACANAGNIINLASFNSVGGAGSYTKGLVQGPSNNSTVMAFGGFGWTPPLANMGSNPAFVPLVEYLPSPVTFVVNSTGAGSLAAGVWCGRVAGVDAVSNETDGSGITCQTVGASSSITWGWTDAPSSALAHAYSGFTLYYCTVASGTCTPSKKITGIAGTATSYNLTSDSGSAGSPNTVTKAMMSWLGADESGNAGNATGTPWSCFFCVNSNSDNWPIGIGMLPTSNVGINLFTKLGVKVGATTFSTLAACSSSLEGAFRAVTDSTTNTWGATITGGGTNHVLAYCDGTNWTVMAK